MQTVTLSRKKKFGFWLLGIVLCVALLLAVSLLVADRFLTAPRVKEYIQQTLVARTGLDVGYEKIGIGSFPSFTLEFHQLTFSIPDTLKGKADILRLSPAILDLLAGKPNLGKVELVRPDIALTLPQPAEKPSETDVPQGSRENQDVLFASIFSAVPVLHANITDGRFSVDFGTQSFSGEHLTLSLDGAAANDRSASIVLKMELAELATRLGERREVISGVKLKGNIRADDGDITWQLDQLSVAKPTLTLSGNLTMAQGAQEIALSLSGTNIDVDATRATALALAGDVSPVTEIFTYLAGGTVPQITFTSRGTSFSELGDFKSFRIEGHLQNGAVAIPEIEMHLAEVNGDVVIADGVLTGTGLSTRLAGSAGHSGLLRLGLAEDNDLFQLELMLNADLGQAQRIVKRIVPKTKFSRELDRITNLKGTGVGKLILGDSLNDINAGIENADINLSFDYQRVPHPISITKGRVNVTKDQVALSGVNAVVGKSHVSGLAATIDWRKSVHLDISGERSGVSLGELYSYLNSMKEIQPLLQDIKEVSGDLELSSATFSGDIGALQQWKYTAAGSVNGMNLKVMDFPGPIQLAKGTFTFDRTQLNAQGVVAAGLDANLVLHGTVNDFSTKSGLKVDVTADGTMGKDSVLWLQETFKVPKAYSIRTPVTLKAVRVAGKPKQALSISGGVSVKDGPQLTLDIQYQPEELKGEKLTVKDQYSEAGMTFVSRHDDLGVSFAGRLSSETLQGLFVDPKWGKGHLEGDFLVNLPKKPKTRATAKGSLKGTSIVIPLGSGDDVSIGQVVLEANGSTVKADAAALSWRDFTWNPLAATIDFEHDKFTIKVGQAALCGIDSPGVFVVSGKDIDLDVTLQGKNLDVGTSYSCLTQGRVKMTGTMEFSSHINAKGEVGEILGRLEGPLKMTFRQGVIEQNRLLSTLLEVLNVTEIVKGRLPNMATTGFTYSVITVDGQFKNGKLVVDKLLVDGETLEILGFGEIDLEKETVNLELLAAPFKTVDTIVKYVPGINYLMGDSLVVVPVHVSGALASPKVSIMSPSSVSKGLLNLGSRVLKLPYKLMESIITGGEKAGKAVF